MENSTKKQISSVTKGIPSMDVKFTDFKEDASTEATAEESEIEPERGNWTGRFDFLLSLLGYSVGLGNVWRFPYLCYNNGGGAFLIPFTVMLIIAGLPLMFMELSFGQYAALGPVAVYNKFCPLFRGLGYGMVIVSCIVMLYYNLIIAWTIYYMFVSFASIFYELPWQHCESEWSTQHCYSYEEADECEARNGTYYLRQCVNQSYAILHNIAALADVALRRPPAEEYFTNQVLGLSSGIEETGHIRLGMALCLFAAWLIVFLCLCKGVQSSGKVVYFTALFPYVVLVILFFRGVTLPGASTGILFYLTPDFSQLANAQVWGDAAVQIFFALSPAWGGLITLSSYNKFSNNCYIDSLIVAVSNIATSFFAGLVIFSVIGFLAHELDVEVDKVVDQGAGLAFIVYPEVVTRLPVSPLWSILFFVMLLTLGLDSQFALMETVTTAILDRFPNFRQKKVWVVLTVAIFGYLGGLIFTTNSGMYWLQLMDKYAANWSVLIIAIGECILIAWIYGAEKFCGDIQQMIGRQSKLWVIFWSAMWRVITPAALVFILVFNWIEYKPASYGHYVYPMWADAVGWTIGVLPVVVVVLMAVDQICSGPDDLTIMEKARVLARPTEEWGPSEVTGTCASALRKETELSPPVLLLHGRPVLRERGTSHDGGDSSSITSGIENEIKRAAAGLVKSKKNSIKKKVQSFSHESDDGVVEPLLQKDKEKPENLTQSAKYLLSKTKTDIKNGKMDDTDRLLCQEKHENSTMKSFSGITEDIANSTNGNYKAYGLGTTTVHNHMNVNVFGSPHGLKNVPTAKSQVLVEINGSNPGSYSSSPLIFTTAKIHADGKKTHMEPVQVTPVPILSTVEGAVIKTSSYVGIEMKNIDPMLTKTGSVKTESLESNLKGLIITTSTPPVLPAVSNSIIEKERLQSDTNKISNTPVSTLRDVKTQNDHLVTTTNTFDLSTKPDAKHTFSTFYGKDECTVQKPILSVKIDVNKNFESSSSDSKPPDLAKTQEKDKTSKTDNATGSKQLQRQKNALDDLDNFSGIKNVNIKTNTQTKEDIKPKLTRTTETNDIDKKDPIKTSQVSSVSTNVPTKSTPNDKATKVLSLENGATGITSSKIIPVSQSDKATSSSIDTGTTLNNTKSTVTVSNQNENANVSIELQTKPTSVPVSIGNILLNESKSTHSAPILPSKITPILPSKIPIGISSTDSPVQSSVSKEEQSKTRPLSTPQSDNSVLKIKPITTSSNKTPITKSMLTSEQSSSTIVSNPDALTSFNTANSSLSNTQNSVPLSTTVSSTFQKSVPKPMSANSQSASSVLPSIKSVSTPVGKSSEPTVSQISAPVNKPSASKKFTANETKQNVCETTTKLTQSSTKPKSTQAATNVVSVKSPTATVPSSSTQKPPVVLNKNQSQRSELKKDKFK